MMLQMLQRKQEATGKHRAHTQAKVPMSMNSLQCVHQLFKAKACRHGGPEHVKLSDPSDQRPEAHQERYAQKKAVPIRQLSVGGQQVKAVSVNELHCHVCRPPSSTACKLCRLELAPLVQQL